MKHKSKVKIYTNSLINIASKMKIFKEVNESLNIILTFFQKIQHLEVFYIQNQLMEMINL